MTRLCVIQARMGSTRLPGKVLADLGGLPVIRFLLRRLEPLTHGLVDHLVVATSVASGDNAIVDAANAEGVPVVRGSEADVLGRFGAALDEFPADVVIRLTADCPLADPEIVVAAIERAEATDADYTSNTLVRTFPDGLDVEVVRAGALRAAIAEADDVAEREHVTPFVYRRPGRFRLEPLFSGRLLGDERWTLDTADDLERIRAIVAALPDPIGARWLDVLAVAERRPWPDAGEVQLSPDVEYPLARGRAWVVARDGIILGKLIVEIRDGGEASLTVVGVPVEVREVAVGLLHRALRADLQVRHLDAPRYLDP
jgi:spore coat polysaccharide biosynthesis protein SpsF